MKLKSDKPCVVWVRPEDSSEWVAAELTSYTMTSDGVVLYTFSSPGKNTKYVRPLSDLGREWLYASVVTSLLDSLERQKCVPKRNHKERKS